jgi:hypothetical protein
MWRRSKICIRYYSSKGTGHGFEVRYSLVGFAVRLLEGVIKGRGGGKYVHRELMKVFKLLLWVADHCVDIRRKRRERRRGRRAIH